MILIPRGTKQKKRGKTRGTEQQEGLNERITQSSTHTRMVKREEQIGKGGGGQAGGVEHPERPNQRN